MNDVTTLSQKADALEEKMARELDYIVIKSRLYSMAEGDMGPPPNAGAADEGQPERARVDGRRSAPAGDAGEADPDGFLQATASARRMHLLQSARHAVKAGLPEKMVLACLLHDISTIGFIRGDHGYWGAQLVEPYVDEEVTWAIRAHQVLRFYPDESVGYEYPQSYITSFGADYRPDPYVEEDYKRMREPQMVHVGPADHRARHLLVRPRRACRAGRVHRHHRPQLPPAGTGPRLRQQPGRAYVARDDPAGEVSVGCLVPSQPWTDGIDA